MQYVVKFQFDLKWILLSDCKKKKNNMNVELDVEYFSCNMQKQSINLLVLKEKVPTLFASKKQGFFFFL